MAKNRHSHRLHIPDALNPVRQLRVMGRLVRRSVSKPGTAPGTLVPAGPPKVERTRIRFLDYDAERLEDNEKATIEECLELKELPTVSWINVDGIHDVDVIRQAGERFGWHLLIQEDIATPGQRAKMEEFEDYVFLEVPMLRWDPVRQETHEEQLSLLLGRNYVFTFQERYGDVFEGVRERIRSEGTRIRTRGADYLAYALLDAVVDHYYTVLEAVGEYTESLDEQVLSDPRPETMQTLHHLKRELITIRRGIWPVREVLAGIQRSESTHFSEQTRVFLRDVHDHVIQVLDTLEALRDVVSGMADLYLSMVSFRANEIMKVLTIMASIFIPLTFIAGVYGMNFEFMPELAVPWAYPVVWGVMLAVGGGMVLYFRRRGWV